MNNVKRIVFNEVVDNQEQLNQAKFFLRMIEKHIGKDGERRFRLIIEELEEAYPGNNPMKRFIDA